MKKTAVWIAAGVCFALALFFRFALWQGDLLF